MEVSLSPILKVSFAILLLSTPFLVVCSLLLFIVKDDKLEESIQKTINVFLVFLCAGATLLIVGIIIQAAPFFLNALKL